MEPETKIYAVSSLGLWRQRRDLQLLLGGRIVPWPSARPFRLSGIVGWGRRPSGRRALALSSRTVVPALSIEDGFLKGFAPGQDEPSQAFVMDRTGIYFDANAPSDLEALLEQPLQDQLAIDRAWVSTDFIRRHRLSKYNNSPLIGIRQAGVPQGRPYVLLVDQVAGDASIAGACASAESFSAMLEHAASTHSGKTLVVRTHPAAGDRSLLRQAAIRLGIDIVVPARMNPWPLLEDADCVYTVSSQLGFEALMAGKVVHCFGVTYYSGRGLTVDHIAAPRPRRPSDLASVFHRAYIDYSSYLDLHHRKPCSIEKALEQMLTVRDQRHRLEGRVHTGAMSPWKRKAMAPFLVGLGGPPVHHRSVDAAVEAAKHNNGAVALWGSDKPLPDDVEAFRIEDGFIRSKGLGVALTMPSSVAFDDDHVYYDARGESRLEALISTIEPDEALRQRSRDLIRMLVSRGVSKYNVGTAAELPQCRPGQLRILIPGQVEKDASIRFGSPVVKSNAALVDAVRVLFPEAFIVYKEHPDVVSAMRSGGVRPTLADLVVTSGDIMQWIAWADRIETMTSLTGFEALLRGKPVGVHGIPFYAGWGLTDDRHAIPRRVRRVDLETLAAAALIRYPLYVHPLSRMPCRPEDLIDEIASGGGAASGMLDRIIGAVSVRINRLAVRLRDRRLT